MPCVPLPGITTRPSPRPSGNRGRWIIAATVLGSSMEYIDGTVVNVALPNLQSALGATGAQVQWVVEGYALFLSSLLLAGGALGDRFGFRRVFLTGVTLFAGASLWCGFAHGIVQLLFARCLQGIGGALLVPNSLALLSSEFEGSQRARAIGTWSGFAAIMTALGPVAGGWVVQHGSWRWVFFLNGPIALAAIWITWAKVAEHHEPGNRQPLDLTGALLCTAALSSVTYGLIEWSSHRASSHLCVAAGCILLLLFLLTESRAKSPLVPPEMFRNRTFAGANLLTFFLYGALSTTFFYLPLDLIQAQGYRPAQAGAAVLPFILLMFFLSRWAGGLIERWGARAPLIVGPCVAAAGYLLLARAGLGATYWRGYFPAVAVLGLGMTISVAPLTTVVMGSASAQSAGTASGVNNAVSQIAALLALALSAPLFFTTFSANLRHSLAISRVPAPIAEQIQGQERRLGAIETKDPSGRAAVDEAFVGAFHLIALLAAVSAASAGFTAWLTIRDSRPPSAARRF
jgi:EmrB/QacA subfamily drug resistance transporter